MFRIVFVFSELIRNYIFQEGKKKFDKQTAKFCQSQERYLNLSTKKQDNVLQEVGFCVKIKMYLLFMCIYLLCA